MLREVHPILKKLNFKLPNIVEGKFGNIEIKKLPNFPNELFLILENEQWMSTDVRNYFSVFELYSHYKLARGHVVCTGLGFLFRESWLLSKKEVSKITVLEKNKELINYHLKFNSEILSKLEIVNINCYDYTGSCDTLLIDNFEGFINENYFEFFKGVSLLKHNIRNKTLWFWPFEEYIIDFYYKNNHMSISEVYNYFKNKFSLDTLPDLNEEELITFLTFYKHGNFLF